MTEKQPGLPRKTDPGETAGTLAGTPEKMPALPKEIGGQAGPEPTRYGDWEKNGRCTDF